MDWISDFVTSLTWRNVLIGVAIFIVTFLVNLAIVSFILIKIPADYFTSHRKTEFWSGPKPALRATAMIGKNILGVLLVVLGIILSVPGVPGQGLLTILLGIMLLDFPGRRKLELKLLQRQEIVNTINRLRHRFDKPPLELDQA
jgi:hypothetical protein